MPAIQPIDVVIGVTYQKVLRWEVGPIVYKPITGVTKSAPVSITAAAHGIPDGWRVVVVGVRGMAELNASSTPPKCGAYRQATVVDANTIELNQVNSEHFNTYTSGGVLQYNTPMDMTGYTPQLHVTASRTSPTLVEDLSDLVTVDVAGHTMTFEFPADKDWEYQKGFYTFDMVASGGRVHRLLEGPLSISEG